MTNTRFFLIQAIEQKLTFLVTLTSEERHNLLKMGDKSIVLVTHCLSTAQSKADILPASGEAVILS